MSETQVLNRPVLKVDDQGEFQEDWDARDCGARWTVLKNRVTGKVVLVDAYEKRFMWMRKRVVEWAKQVEKLKPFYKRISLTYDVLGTRRSAVNWKPEDIRDFEAKLRRWISRNYPGILVYGMVWVGEVQPVSKHYHYHLQIATDKRLHFPGGLVEWMWGKGFTKISVPRSAFYLVSYLKKRDQKDYFFFPRGARGFAVWLAPWAISSSGERLKCLLRYHSLKNWQFEYIGQHSQGDDLEKDLDLLKGTSPPGSDWSWVGSWVKRSLAEGAEAAAAAGAV